MGNLDLNNAALSTAPTYVTINSKTLDSPNGEGDYEYVNTNWTKQYGKFTSVADLKNVIVLKGYWTIGGGYTCDPLTKEILRHVKGFGKDTFKDILFNMEMTKRIGGDAFCEIIRGDDKAKTIINLKPLNPETMKIIYDSQGMIKRYEQFTKGKIIKWEPNEIFHLCNNRIGDQVHGLSDIDVNNDTIDAMNESDIDMRRLMHWQSRPMIVFKLKTDDSATINAFIAKMDAATENGKNVYVPFDENEFSYEIVQAPIQPGIFEYRNELRKKFYRTSILPELLPSGGGDATESGGKIGYLAFQRIVEKEQADVEAQILNQLGLEINLIPPVSLEQNLMQDNAKDPSNFQPSDTTAGVGR